MLFDVKLDKHFRIKIKMKKTSMVDYQSYINFVQQTFALSFNFLQDKYTAYTNNFNKFDDSALCCKKCQSY